MALLSFVFKGRRLTINLVFVDCIGANWFVALGEIYRVAHLLHLSLQYFKPWVLADPGMFSKMLACWDSCINAWTSGLEKALKTVVDSNHLAAPAGKALLESIISINELEVANFQHCLANNELTCRLTLLPTGLLPGYTFLPGREISAIL